MEKVSISKVVPDKNQPRKYFAADKMGQLNKSIKKNGIMNPILVQKEGDKFLIVDGERRYRTAVELGLKEVPIVIMAAKDPVERLIEQFHIQEMHEGWSPVEKAMVLIGLTEVTKKPLREVCEMLSIPVRTAQGYYAFSHIQNKEKFLENQVPLEFAQPMVALNNFVKQIKLNELEETFSLTDARKFEKAVIENIKKGSIEVKFDFSNMKDAFKSAPKMIDKFMEGMDAQDVFVKSKAKGARALRQAMNHCSYLQVALKSFTMNPDVELTAVDISGMRSAIKALKGVLDLAGAE